MQSVKLTSIIDQELQETTSLSGSESDVSETGLTSSSDSVTDDDGERERVKEETHSIFDNQNIKQSNKNLRQEQSRQTVQRKKLVMANINSSDIDEQATNVFEQNFGPALCNTEMEGHSSDDELSDFEEDIDLEDNDEEAVVESSKLNVLDEFGELMKSQLLCSEAATNNDNNFISHLPKETEPIGNYHNLSQNSVERSSMIDDQFDKSHVIETTNDDSSSQDDKNALGVQDTIESEIEIEPFDLGPLTGKFAEHFKQLGDELTTLAKSLKMITEKSLGNLSPILQRKWSKMQKKTMELFQDKIIALQEEEVLSTAFMDKLKRNFFSANEQIRKLQKRVDICTYGAKESGRKLKTATEQIKHQHRRVMAAYNVQNAIAESECIQVLLQRIEQLGFEAERERDEAQTKLRGALETNIQLRQEIARLKEEKMLAATKENMVPHLQRWYRFHYYRRNQLLRLRQVLKLDKWFKVLTTEIEYQLLHGATTHKACVQAMYLMLESKLRRPHYYAMVKLLQLGDSAVSHVFVAQDAFELFGEGRNWIIRKEDLCLVATAMAFLHIIIVSLDDDPRCSINDAVFYALALKVEVPKRS